VFSSVRRQAYLPATGRPKIQGNLADNSKVDETTLRTAVLLPFDGNTPLFSSFAEVFLAVVGEKEPGWKRRIAIPMRQKGARRGESWQDSD
jgi:hypothetical protein